MRVLPIHVEPIVGETCDGYVARLAHAHAADMADIRRLAIREVGRHSWNGADPRLRDAVEQMAGIAAGALMPSFEEHGMWIRCGHRDWKPRKCERCRVFTKPRAACSICAGGAWTQMIARGGPYCLEHHQWTLGDMSLRISDDAYESAERTMRATLWERGIALHTGELQLAATFVLAATNGSRGVAPIHARAAQHRATLSPDFGDVLTWGYPEVIRTALLLSTRSLVARVLDISRPATAQADLLARAIAEALGLAMSAELLDSSTRVVGHAHRAILHARGLRRARRTKVRPCPPERALIVASFDKRACLLRHAPPGVIRTLSEKRTGGTEPPRVTRKRELVPDDLALE